MDYALHIGFPETGSTSLQAALSENRQALLRHGVVYPETGITSKSKLKHKGLHDVFRGIGPERVGMPMDWVERFGAETACETTQVPKSFIQPFQCPLPPNSDQ